MLRIGLAEDVGGDLDQVDSSSPRFQSVKTSASADAPQAAEPGQQVVGLGDELHVDVLDAVVDHLHVVTGAVRTDIGRARHAAHHRLAGGEVLERHAGARIHLGRDGFPDRPQVLPGSRMTARHEGRAEAGPDLAPAHARAEEAAAVRVHLLSADGVGPLAVAAVDDDVVGLEAGGAELVHESVHRGPGLDEDHDLPRLLEGSEQVGERGATNEAAPCVRVAAHELVHGRRRAVVDRDPVPVIGHVEREVLAHHRQPDQPDVRPPRFVHDRPFLRLEPLHALAGHVNASRTRRRCALAGGLADKSCRSKDLCPPGGREELTQTQPRGRVPGWSDLWHPGCSI